MLFVPWLAPFAFGMYAARTRGFTARRCAKAGLLSGSIAAFLLLLCTVGIALQLHFRGQLVEWFWPVFFGVGVFVLYSGACGLLAGAAGGALAKRRVAAT